MHCGAGISEPYWLMYAGQQDKSQLLHFTLQELQGNRINEAGI